MCRGRNRPWPTCRRPRAPARGRGSGSCGPPADACSPVGGWRSRGSTRPGSNRRGRRRTPPSRVGPVHVLEHDDLGVRLAGPQDAREEGPAQLGPAAQRVEGRRRRSRPVGSDIQPADERQRPREIRRVSLSQLLDLGEGLGFVVAVVDAWMRRRASAIAWKGVLRAYDAQRPSIQPCGSLASRSRNRAAGGTCRCRPRRR